MPRKGLNELGYEVSLTMCDEPKEVRAESFDNLRSEGFDFSLYPWEGLPVGRRKVILERKNWGKGMAISCYFLDIESQDRYRISVFRDRRSSEYMAGELDISRTPVGSPLEIEIMQNGTGSFRIKTAALISED